MCDCEKEERLEQLENKKEEKKVDINVWSKSWNAVRYMNYGVCLGTKKELEDEVCCKNKEEVCGEKARGRGKSIPRAALSLTNNKIFSTRLRIK